MALIGRQLGSLSDRVVLDNIAVTTTDTFNLLLNGVAFVPNSAEALTVSLNGIIQKPQGSYTVSGSQIIFSSSLTSGTDVIDFIIAERAITLQTPSAGSVGTSQLANGAVTPAKLGYDYNQYRNIIINGDMSIAQRSTSVASITTTGYYTLDRFDTFLNILGTWTMSQDSDVPTAQGFAKSLKFVCTTANASPASAARFLIRQTIEGQNLQYLLKGTASAKSLTASFWVKSNKTGTFILSLYDVDNGRRISKSYTINSADTWEKKTITFAGDTTGSFDNDNAGSLAVQFLFGAGTNFTSGTLATSWETNTDVNSAVGQVNLADSTSNYINFTGVQLEAGTTASDFEFLPVDVNLGRCQRYFVSNRSGANVNGGAIFLGLNTNEAFGGSTFPVYMRSAPTMTIYRSDQTSGYAERLGGGSAACSAALIGTSGFSQLSGSGTIVANYQYACVYQANAEL